jgi:hypothetical protein
MPVRRPERCVVEAISELKKMFAEARDRLSFRITRWNAPQRPPRHHDAQALSEAKVPLSTEGDGVEGQSPNCHRMRTLLKSRPDVMVRCLQ